MIHPNLENLKNLTDSQIEQKILRLNSIYFMTENQDVRQQMILLLDSFKLELESRRVAARKLQDENNEENELDNLIKVR